MLSNLLAVRILSIQSSVAYGHVGNSAAVFPLQRLGIDVLPVNTVQFSNHTGYGSWRGPVLPPDQIAEVIVGLQEVGALAGVDAVLSGYVGDVGSGAVILDAVRRVRELHPGATYCLDPVIGDAGPGVYVRPGVPELIRDRALPAADIVTPNQFELEYLTGAAVTTVSSALAAAGVLLATGPRVALVTSLRVEGLEPDSVGLLAVTGSAAYLLTTPLLPLTVDGAGDMTAALFLAHWLPDADLAGALARAGNTVYAVLEETCRRGDREIAQIPAQQAIADPPTRFSPVRLR